MKIKIWGARGSIPAPLQSEEVEHKLFRAIRGMPTIDTNDEEAVWDYIHNLAPSLRGTVGGNTACIEVQADNTVFAMDAGSGLYQMGLELMHGAFGRGEGTLHLFISHGHWDHIQGFTMFKPAFVPGNRIFIYGAHDLEAIFEFQQRPVTWPVSLSYMQADIQFVQIEPGEPFNIGKVRVECIKNAHPGDAYSYRLEDQHSIFVYASDAEYKKLEDNIVNPYVQFFRNADALIFDAMYTLEDAWLQEDYGHSSAMIGVDLAHAAGVKRLILFHHDPTYSDEQIERIHAAAVGYQKRKSPSSTELELIIAREGEIFDLTPPGAVDLQFSSNGETAILTPTSIFDERGIDELERQFARLYDQYSAPNSIIDLAQVETFSTASLKSLFALRQKWKNRPIILASPPENIQEIIKLGGYEDSFAIYPTVGAALAAVQAREALNLPGQIIHNRYQIEKRVGDSPLGTVLQAKDTHNGQTVALKILSPAYSQETLERFMHQAQRLVTLNHPNILKVFAVGREGDTVFRVEEFVGASTLEDFLKTHAPSRERSQTTEQTPETESASPLLDIAMDIVNALEYAHSRGIILGDLKPKNIFLTTQGARLNDLGLGRLVEGRNLLEMPRLFLSANYLAPEQILGQALDARTDLYAFGVVLYQLFTGHLPFEEAAARADQTDARTDTAERTVLEAHLRQAPRRPRKLNPHISISLEHLILKLLAQNPNDRYASALQVRRILSSLFSDMENATRPRIYLLVGREKHAQTLRASWQDAAAGHGQLAFITGEAGIGKSRLAQQVAAQSHPPVLLIGRCADKTGHAPYELFTEILRTYLTTVPPEFFDADARQQLGNFAPLIPEIHQMLPDLHIPPPLEPKQEQLRLMTSLTQFIRQATQERPWFIILEDLQWADRSSLELLLYLGRHLPSLPVFIIGTYRDTELDRDHPLQETLRRLRGHPTYRRVQLERLTQDEVSQVLTYIWQLTVPDALAERIYQHTAGNPFYVEEVAKGLEDDGLVPLPLESDLDPMWHIRALAEIHLPQSARETVWRRVDHLSAETQALLRQAAVLGQTFQFDDLQKMTGLSEWDVLERLDEALEHQMVEEVQGGNALRFRQTEIQYVIYNDLGQLRRRLLHRKAGEALEKRAEPQAVRLAEELAYHFGEAGEIKKAIDYSIQAARQAQLTYANETALQWYTRVLDMLAGYTDTASRTTRLQAHQAAGEVLTLIGRYDEALEHYAQALESAEIGPVSAEQHQRLAELCYLAATVYELRDEYDTALMWLNSGLNYIGAAKPTVEVAHIYLLGAKVYIRQRKDAQAMAWCEKSLNTAAQIQSREGLLAIAAALHTQVGIKLRQGNRKQAVQLCLESVRAYREIGDPVGESNAYNVLGTAYAGLGDWQPAEEAYAKGLVIKKEIGDIYGEAILTHNLAFQKLKRGQWDQAEQLCERALAIWRQVAAARGEAATLNNIAQIYVHQQNWTQAEQALNRSQMLLNDINAKEHLPELERVWGEYYLHIGNTTQAQTHIQRAIDLAVQYDDPTERGAAYRVLGQIHLANSAYQEAKTALNNSLHTLDDVDYVYEMAKTKAMFARLALETDVVSREKARCLLAQAIKTFEKLDAQVNLAEARALEQRLASM